MAADAQQFELTETPSFLNHILDKTTQLCKIPFEVEPLEEHAVTLDKTISLLRKLEDCFQFEDNEKTQLQKITSAFDDFLQGWNHLLSRASFTTTTVANLGSNRQAIFLHPGGHRTIHLLKHLKNFVDSVSPGAKLLKYWVFRGGLY